MDGTDLLTIGQLSTRAGIAASAIRFYEQMGLLDLAGRTEANRRLYTRDTLRRLAFIRACQHVGILLDDVKTVLDTLPADRPATPAEWEAIATVWRRKLDEQQQWLERLRGGLGECIGCGCMSFEACQRLNPGDGATRLGHGPRFWKGDSPSDVAPGR